MSVASCRSISLYEVLLNDNPDLGMEMWQCGALDRRSAKEPYFTLLQCKTNLKNGRVQNMRDNLH